MVGDVCGYGHKLIPGFGSIPTDQKQLDDLASAQLRLLGFVYSADNLDRWRQNNPGGKFFKVVRLARSLRIVSADIGASFSLTTDGVFKKNWGGVTVKKTSKKALEDVDGMLYVKAGSYNNKLYEPVFTKGIQLDEFELTQFSIDHYRYRDELGLRVYADATLESMGSEEGNKQKALQKGSELLSSLAPRISALVANFNGFNFEEDEKR